MINFDEARDSQAMKKERATIETASVKHTVQASD